jgi:UDP-N-acetylmuramoyl-tripeptide--D-alanyl-D-alanine ligase
MLEALSGAPYEQVRQVITEATVDSRLVIPGGLFVALPGEHSDGHDYVADAFQRGAQFALVQRDLSAQYPMVDLRTGKLPDAQALTNLEAPACLWVDDSLQSLQQAARFWRRKLETKVIGITGSVGKSTTKEVVAEVLGQHYRTLKTHGNLNNEIGLPLMLLSLSEGHERAVLEMGFYVKGEIAFLCELALPEIGVVTNIGMVHASRAGDQQAIAQGKGELVESLPEHGVAILNYDDPLVREMAKRTKAQVMYFGMDPAADIWADAVEGLGLDGIRFCLHYQGEELHLRVPMIGRHSVQTALRATAVGLADGLTWQEIVDGLRSSPTQLRLMAVRCESGALLLDDTYNASPESMMAALNLLDELDGRKIAVLGDMLELGQYEWVGHEKVGIRAAQVADLLVTAGERGRMIAAAAARAGMDGALITEFETTDQVVEFLKPRLQSGDVVLVKGSRGMHMERIVSALESER